VGVRRGFKAASLVYLRLLIFVNRQGYGTLKRRANEGHNHNRHVFLARVIGHVYVVEAGINYGRSRRVVALDAVIGVDEHEITLDDGDQRRSGVGVPGEAGPRLDGELEDRDV
jgi:hypothetical protein